MIKKIVMLCCLLSFMFSVRLTVIRVPIDLFDSMNILFLNFKEYSQYGLSSFNFVSCIYFMLLYILVLSFFIENKNEYVSYLSLIVYRQALRKTIRQRSLMNMKKGFILWLATMLLINTLGFIKFGVIDFSYQFILSLYFLRFYFVFVSIGLFYDLFSMLGLSMKGYFLINFCYLFAFSTDLLIHSHFVSFSGTLISEIIYLLIPICLFFVVYLLGVKYCERKGDIL